MICKSKKEGIVLTVEDKSYSSYCPSGLLENRDNIALDIIIDTRGVPENEKSGFILEGRDPVDNYTITVCSINFKEQCSTVIRLTGCLCEKQADGYHISASFPADIHFRDFLLKVNGKQYKKIQSREVYRLKPNISLKVNGRHVPMKTNCQAYAPWEAIVHYELCVAGLNSPNLTLSYSGVNVTGSAGCISADVETPDTNENIYIHYHDRCKRDVKLSCYVRGSGDETDTFYDDDKESAWRAVFFVSILLLGTSGLLFILCKIKQMFEPEQKNYEHNIEGLSSVDPKKMSLASSSMKKLSEILSPRTTDNTSVMVSIKSDPKFDRTSEV